MKQISKFLFEKLKLNKNSKIIPYVNINKFVNNLFELILKYNDKRSCQKAIDRLNNNWNKNNNFDKICIGFEAFGNLPNFNNFYTYNLCPYTHHFLKSLNINEDKTIVIIYIIENNVLSVFYCNTENYNSKIWLIGYKNNETYKEVLKYFKDSESDNNNSPWKQMDEDITKYFKL